LFSKYANNAAKFSVSASSQANESVNNIMCHKAPKNYCYSLSESSDYRYSSTVCTKNDGENYLLDVVKELCVSPGKHTKNFASRRDKIRREKARKAKLPSTKCCKNILIQERTLLREQKEKAEGTQYKSNCGLELDAESSSIDIDVSLVETTSRNLEKSSDDYKIVYFDLETSGFSKTADILQIAAKCGEHNFSVYVNPTQSITESASKVIGLNNINGELFLHGTKVVSIPSRDALYSFLQYLQLSSQLCILVAHNARFDISHLLRAIKSHNMIDDFKQIIGEFADSLVLLKKKFPDRKGPGLFKLSTLAQDLLQRNDNENFHNATYDVEVLENIVCSTISKEEIFKNTKSFVASLMYETQLQNIHVIVKSLYVLKGIISDAMIKKMATSGITYKKTESNSYRK